MQSRPFPVIDPVATGKNILRLRNARGMSVRDMQAFFGFDAPQAIYKWQQGTSLPTVDNLYALSALLEVSMEEILIPAKTNITKIGQQEVSCCPVHLYSLFRLPRLRQASGDSSAILPLRFTHVLPYGRAGKTAPAFSTCIRVHHARQVDEGWRRVCASSFCERRFCV